MTHLRKVALIYNPAAGRRHAGRARQIQEFLAELRKAGVDAQAIATHAPGTAGQQAHEAVCQGAHAIFACGGDGTVHEVLQGMVGSPAALGVVPLGTANSLAADLGVPRRPAAIVRALLAAEPIRVAVGKLEYQDARGQLASRYFAVAVGVGPDAHLFYVLSEAVKHRFGYIGYYLKAAGVWAMHRYPLFEVEFTPPGAESSRRELASQLLAVRITNFGGFLRRLAPGAALQRNDLRLVLFKTRSRLRYLQYMSTVFLGREPHVPGVELLDAASVTSRPFGSADQPIRVEADGECLGTLPARLTIVPDAVTLLRPQPQQVFGRAY